jgi:hypothetical protein
MGSVSRTDKYKLENTNNIGKNALSIARAFNANPSSFKYDSKQQGYSGNQQVIRLYDKVNKILFKTTLMDGRCRWFLESDIKNYMSMDDIEFIYLTVYTYHYNLETKKREDVKLSFNTKIKNAYWKWMY